MPAGQRRQTPRKIPVPAAGAAADDQYPSILETYTALPSHLEAPVWQMAQEITADFSTPYDRAFAIQNYLSRNYRYTLDTAMHPANQDFVTAFLFSGRAASDPPGGGECRGAALRPRKPRGQGRTR